MAQDKKRVVVGMSGGVDSSVAALLLKEAGYDVYGVTLNIWPDEDGPGAQNSACCGLGVADDAARVAGVIGIPFEVVDFKEPFQENVIDYFCDAYLKGITPNPCIVCNRYVKWEALLSYADKLGAGYIATGHYARVVQLQNGRYTLKRAAYEGKDQTYALYRLTQRQLSRTIMPLGEYEKPQIREIAKKAGLPVADKAESQEICFIPDHDYASYIKRHAGMTLPTGNLVDTEGNILGRHNGITHYTIGQRKGLNISLGRPAYVVAIRPGTNEVVIGDNEDVFASELICDDLNWMGTDGLHGKEIEIQAKIRYNHRGAVCRIREDEDGKVECFFPDRVRAVTPGQAVVFYDAEARVLGGGTILA